MDRHALGCSEHGESFHHLKSHCHILRTLTTMRPQGVEATTGILLNAYLKKLECRYYYRKITCGRRHHWCRPTDTPSPFPTIITCFTEAPEDNHLYIDYALIMVLELSKWLSESVYAGNTHLLCVLCVDIIVLTIWRGITECATSLYVQRGTWLIFLYPRAICR